MKTALQLMVYGDDISSWSVSIDGAGLKVTDVHKADSPNYLFVDVAVSPSAKPGTYDLVFTKGNDSFRKPYEILAREPGSAERTSFTTSDFIYLINPDRFANADPGNDNTDDTFEKAKSWQALQATLNTIGVVHSLAQHLEAPTNAYNLLTVPVCADNGVCHSLTA
jgi:hypothetical protein